MQQWSVDPNCGYYLFFDNGVLIMQQKICSQQRQH